VHLYGFQALEKIDEPRQLIPVQGLEGWPDFLTQDLLSGLVSHFTRPHQATQDFPTADPEAFNLGVQLRHEFARGLFIAANDSTNQGQASLLSVPELLIQGSQGLV
jgi:hypothetical protein